MKTREEMITEVRNLVSFSELSADWQAEAVSNFDSLEEAEGATYIEPKAEHVAGEHILFDLSACMRSNGPSAFDGIITISNNSGLGIRLLASREEALVTYL